MSNTSSRNERLATRREEKFDRLDIWLANEAVTELRGSKDEPVTLNFTPVTLNFTHAVYRRGKLVGRQLSRRSQLKRAHQACRDLR